MKRTIYAAALVAAVFMVSACTTNPVTGQKKFGGLIRIPFTGNAKAVDATDPAAVAMAQMIEQLAPLVWLALPLIVGGAAWWFVTKGHTGLGRVSFGLGWLFVFAAVLIPQIVAAANLPFIMGGLGVVVVVAAAAVAGFFVYDLIRKRKNKLKIPKTA